MGKFKYKIFIKYYKDLFNVEKVFYNVKYDIFCINFVLLNIFIRLCYNSKSLNYKKYFVYAFFIKFNYRKY